ncbi:MAG: 3-isopropylmalate dehydratase small subunit [Planctomycetota bacterium]|jgi:3-isopropylmalate/(R)-2-methylmalate dehydratase small subunit
MEGKCWKFGDDVNTDEIIPAIYLDVTDEREMAPHCMEGIDSQFAGSVKPGAIIVAGRNFGCGSSREHAPLAIKACGVQYVVAQSFARIFFRNAINIGLRIAECPEAAQEAETGDVLEVDFAAGTVVNRTKGKNYAFPPFSPEIQAIIDAGGLIRFAREQAGLQ